MFLLRNKMRFPEPLLNRKSTCNLNAVNIWRKILQNPFYWRVFIHSSSMPPFWMKFRCPKALQTWKTLFVYALLGVVLAPDFWLLNFDFWELGISFKSNMASTKQRELEQSKQQHKAATRIEILSRKSEKWMYSLRTVPVPYLEIPFTSGKSANCSFIVLGSWFEFCPKIDISVKWEY